ncbi:hypothetical protein F4680DRAFT_450360 [Xylaria scruposa]|nr:hypothetical protein F4680DRAFT_450360 [Xylaria scruposa]
MTSQTSQRSVLPNGFTTLHEGGPDPECDIVFIHGLNGRPDKSWTYSDTPSETKVRGSTGNLFKRVLKRDKGSVDIHDKSPDRSPDRSPDSAAVKVSQDVFWPNDLLPKEDICKTARIMTYGYDSDVIKLVDNANFSTITDHGETLLNGLARVRASCQKRPLMLIAHSLGGLVVKSALNNSVLKTDHDLRAVVESTFAIIFFSTPHRGGNFVEIGKIAAGLASILTLRPYNTNIVTNLARNNELLRQLRQNFDSSTVNIMIKKSGFQSSTFQESKGFATVAGFRGKVVEDDAAEATGTYDRNDHIESNHINMIRFSGFDDPEYKKVIGEIERHMKRLRRAMDEEKSKLCESLEVLGKYADKWWNDIDTNTPGTLHWLYRVNANKGEDPKSKAEPSITLDAWLARHTGIFWITGRPGSGKSTVMKYLSSCNSEISNVLYTNAETLGRSVESVSSSQCPLPPKNRGRSIDVEPASSKRTEWCIVKLFVTNRGNEHQNKWQPMLHGLLWQLLTQRPEMIRSVMTLAKKKKGIAHPGGHDMTSTEVQETYEWPVGAIEHALEVCKTQATHRLNVLIILDGLDEMKFDKDIHQCVSFLRRLSDVPATSQNIFKVCISSRSERLFLDLLSGVWRIEIHNYTKNDIKQHVLSRIREIRRFRTEPVDPDLRGILRYIVNNSHGVFLWARSVTNLVVTALSDGETLDKANNLLRALPTEMSELYKYTLRRIEPRLRTKAYIMLESVMRARTPLTLLELALIVHVAERMIANKSNTWSDHSGDQYPSPKDFLDPVRLQTQLIVSCRCILEISSGTSDNWFDDPPYLSDFSEDDDELADFPSLGRTSNRQLFPPPARDRWFDEETDITKNNEGLPVDANRDSTMVVAAKPNAELEIMERNQYNPNHLKSRVKLLHRSARDFLLEPSCLGTLFQNDGAETALSSKPYENGHVYILQFARAWLGLPEVVRSQLGCGFAVVRETAYHAPQLEFTLGSAVAARFFPVLDDIDQRLSTHHRFHDSWPTEWFEHQSNNDIRNWNFTFPAFAVAMNMRGYIEHRIKRAKEHHDGDHFINGKSGRPLLFFSVYLPDQEPKPDMTKFLLEEGANVHARFDDKTAIESFSIDEIFGTGSPHLEIMQHLLEYGGDPNSRYIPFGQYPLFWYPLIHIVAHVKRIHSGPRFEFMRHLVDMGADINGSDYDGVTFLEALYWGNKEVPPQEWDWILRNGGKITRSMISAHSIELHDRVARASLMRRTPPKRRGMIELAHRWSSLDYFPTTVSRLKRNELMLWSGNSSLIDKETDSDLLSPLDLPLKGLCDGDGKGHDAYEILKRESLRKREYYEPEALQIIKSYCPDWFPKSRLL